MVSDIKFCINTDNETYGPPKNYVNILNRLGMRDDTNNDVVLNIASIAQKRIKKGTKCTIFIEGDAFIKKGTDRDFYDNSDIVYVPEIKYLSCYKPNTRKLNTGIDIDYHYPRDVKKEYDYVFVGRNEGCDVYDNRIRFLDSIKNSKFNILIKGGDPNTYCEDLSSGRIILNVMPRRGDDVCVNMRIFEGMAIGTLMTDDDEIFKDYGFIRNVHYLPLERFGEDFSDEELERIHIAGRNIVCNTYTYQKAIKQIIKDVEEYL